MYLLGQACEIEHGLMCEYLYAQFSLKRGVDEGLTEGQLARVQAWEKALISVIKQEMLHLALATNILTAIGAAPHFERPNFPILSRWYPEGVQVIKERLDALQQACASLGQQAGLGQLAPLADKLQSMSQDIGTHGASTGG